MAPEVKTAKNSKLPKLPDNYFELVGKGGWPSISTWIRISIKIGNIVTKPCKKDPEFPRTLNKDNVCIFAQANTMYNTQCTGHMNDNKETHGDA
jgi:hypothetical protein